MSETWLPQEAPPEPEVKEHEHAGDDEPVPVDVPGDPAEAEGADHPADRHRDHADEHDV